MQHKESVEGEKRRRRRKKRRRKTIQKFLKKIGIFLLGCFLLVLVLQNAGGVIRQMHGKVEEQWKKREVEELKKQIETQSGKETFPESLLELLDKNPEAQNFVLNYEENKDKEWDRDVSEEVVEGKMPLFIQWDERWGYETYGGDFLAVTGCGPTCLSMVICGLTGETNWNPYEVAKWAEEQGYYVEGSGSAWDLMVSGAKNFGLTSREVVFDETHIMATLESGIPIVCAMRPGDFTTSGHFLVLTGVDEQGDIQLNDPNSLEKSSQSWEIEDLMPQIKNLWALSDE